MTKKREQLESVGVIIRQFRTARRFSQKRVGIEMDVSASYISLLESGKSYPSIGTLIRLAEAMKVRPGELLDAIAEREKIMQAKTDPADEQNK